jgi:hypothetical protein
MQEGLKAMEIKKHAGSAKVLVTVPLPRDLHAKAKAAAAIGGVSLEAALVACVREIYGDLAVSGGDVPRATRT